MRMIDRRYMHMVCALVAETCVKGTGSEHEQCIVSGYVWYTCVNESNEAEIKESNMGCIYAIRTQFFLCAASQFLAIIPRKADNIRDKPLEAKFHCYYVSVCVLNFTCRRGEWKCLPATDSLGLTVMMVVPPSEVTASSIFVSHLSFVSLPAYGLFALPRSSVARPSIIRRTLSWIYTFSDRTFENKINAVRRLIRLMAQLAFLLWNDGSKSAAVSTQALGSASSNIGCHIKALPNISLHLMRKCTIRPHQKLSHATLNENVISTWKWLRGYKERRWICCKVS